MASTPTGADIAGAAPSPAMDPFQILMQKLDRMADDHQQELAGLKDQIQALVGVKEQVHTATEQVQIVQAEQASTTQQVHTVTEQVQVVQAELQVVRESTTQQDAEIQTLKDASTAQGVVLAQHTVELANIQPSVSTLLDDRINQIGGSIEERLCSQVAAKIETFATGNNGKLASLNDRIQKWSRPCDRSVSPEQLKVQTFTVARLTCNLACRRVAEDQMNLCTALVMVHKILRTMCKE